MAQQNSGTTAAEPAVNEPGPMVDQAELGLGELARAILARDIRRPRVAQVRRLAEAVLATEDKRARKKAGGKKKAGKKKLAKIPGQKPKK